MEETLNLEEQQLLTGNIRMHWSREIVTPDTNYLSWKRVSKGGGVVVKSVRTNLVIPAVSVLGNGTVKGVIGVKIVEINKLSFERVVIAFHRRIVVGTTGAAHALLDAVVKAEINELRGSELRPLIRM